jgi:hypothetical protein
VKNVTNIRIEWEVGKNILDSSGFSKTVNWMGVDEVVCIFGTELCPNQRKNKENTDKI